MQTVPVDGMPRQFLVHLPVGYAPGHAYPLLIAYHDRFLPPPRWAQISGLNDVADRQNFIVIYPEARSGMWNLGIPAPAPAMRERYPRRRFGYPGRFPGGGFPGGPGGGYPGRGGYPGGGYPGRGQQPRRNERGRFAPARDLAFFDALLTKAEQEYTVNPNRVYLTGMGLGGMMALRVACMRASRVAAVAVVGAALPRALAEECVPARPISLLMINGKRDPLVRYGGGRGGSGYETLSAPDTAKLWAKVDNCTAKPRQYHRQFRAGQRKVQVVAWAGCAAGTMIQFDTLAHGGGAWPGGGYQPESRFGKTSQALNGSEAVWRFLAPLRRNPGS